MVYYRLLQQAIPHGVAFMVGFLAACASPHPLRGREGGGSVAVTSREGGGSVAVASRCGLALCRCVCVHAHVCVCVCVGERRRERKNERERERGRELCVCVCRGVRGSSYTDPRDVAHVRVLLGRAFLVAAHFFDAAHKVARVTLEGEPVLEVLPPCRAERVAFVAGVHVGRELFVAHRLGALVPVAVRDLGRSAQRQHTVSTPSAQRQQKVSTTSATGQQRVSKRPAKGQHTLSC